MRFLYFDPIRALDQEAQIRWSIPGERKRMLNEAREATGRLDD